MVILTKEDLASLPVEQSHEIEVTEFVPADQVDPVAFDSAYFLEPASRSNRAYVLMREALESTDRLAICTFTLRSRTRLCALRVYKDILMLQTLLWPDEAAPAGQARSDVTYSCTSPSRHADRRHNLRGQYT